MNFIESVEAGQRGINAGFNIGLDKLNEDISGLTKGMNLVIAGESKSGKTSFAVDQFILSVVERNDVNINNLKYIFFSFEISRIETEAKLASYFIKKEYNKNFSTKYILGRDKKNGKPNLLSDSDFQLVQNVYKKHIIPIMGEYNSNNERVREGLIDFIEDKCTPEKVLDILYSTAIKNGSFTFEQYHNEATNKMEQRVSGYIPKDPNKLIVVILDHIRLVSRNGKSLKEAMDETHGYITDYARICKFACITLVHLNRSISDIERIKYLKDSLYPTQDEIKDSSNLAENVTDLITIFNPADDKYKLKTHFGVDLENNDNNYRSVHLVLARYNTCPIHYQCHFEGSIGAFTEWKK